MGPLRAVGQTRGQSRSMVRWESVLVAAFGTPGGLLPGGFLGRLLVGASAGDTAVAFALPPLCSWRSLSWASSPERRRPAGPHG